MTPEQVIHFYKNNKLKAAAHLGVTPMTVYNWLNQGYIAPHRQRLIERMTNKALLADDRDEIDE